MDDDKTLTDIQKLTYLKGQLEVEAAKLVFGFKLEPNSYSPAVQLLKDNYGRRDRINYALVTDLTTIVKPQNTTSTSSNLWQNSSPYTSH